MNAMPSEVLNAIDSFTKFAEGVPADDATCNSIIAVLESLFKQEWDDEPQSPYNEFRKYPWDVPPGQCHYCDLGIPFKVGENHYVQISVSYADADDASGTLCLEAAFRTRPAQWGMPIEARDFAKTPEGLRQMIAWVKAAAKDLKVRGLCPKCNAALRIPTADYCAKCCLGASVDL